MSRSVLRWGILSTARIGAKAVCPAIAASDNGELRAVASRDGARARSFAEANGIPVYYGSYAELIGDPDVDAVYIPLPNSLHREWTVRAAEAGKHVLCEKPFAMSERECRQMEAAADANGVRLMEAFMYSFHPRTRRAVELVRTGAVGDLRLIRSSFTFRLRRDGDIRLDPALGGGALMDIGCYCVHVSRALAGAEPVEVQADACWTPSGVDEQMTGLLRFPDDVLAVFDCSLAAERREFYEAAGTEGHVSVGSAFVPGPGEPVLELHRGRDDVTTERLAAVDQYREMVESFAGGVFGGGPMPCSGREAALNMRTIEALYRSAREGGRRVELGPGSDR